MIRYFAADLHLDPAQPEIARRCFEFLAGPVREADALYLLGDLFESWIGDDDPSEAGAVLMGRSARDELHGMDLVEDEG